MMTLEAEAIAEAADAHIPDSAASPDAETVVEVHDVSKKFARSLRRSLFYAARDLGRELAGKDASTDLRKDEFWALQDISFTLKKGEAIGIIGPNGAGKSTLLKIINGIIKPSSGFVRTRGRVQALIELSAGMNPILTGRENIYIRAMLLGLSRTTIDERLDGIVAFAELEDFIDMPVQNYSSGMRVKLGFSIAINVDPDILILDEVLAVGDEVFRIKARKAMMALLARDVALIFISHNMTQVMGVTERAIELKQGLIVRFGDSTTVCTEYLAGSQKVSPTFQKQPTVRRVSRFKNLIELCRVDLSGGERVDDAQVKVHWHDDVTITAHLQFNASHSIDSTRFSVSIFAERDGGNGHRDAHIALAAELSVQSGAGFELPIKIDMSTFSPGVFYFGVIIKCEDKIPINVFSSSHIFSVVKGPPKQHDQDWSGRAIYAPRMLGADLGGATLKAWIDQETTS